MNQARGITGIHRVAERHGRSGRRLIRWLREPVLFSTRQSSPRPYSGVRRTGMMQRFDPESFDAFAQLLARPDPEDLPRRAHVYRYEGDPNRRVTRFPGILMGWLQRRHLETDIEAPLAPAT